MILTAGGLQNSGKTSVGSVPTFVHYDLQKIKELKQNLELNIEFILSELPDVNWNSFAKTKVYFENWFDIKLESAKINHLQAVLKTLPDGQASEILYGYTTYLRHRSTIKNYLDHIIKHNGIVSLTYSNGTLVMPNHRPVSCSPEIQNCEVDK